MDSCFLTARYLYVGQAADTEDFLEKNLISQGIVGISSALYVKVAKDYIEYTREMGLPLHFIFIETGHLVKSQIDDLFRFVRQSEYSKTIPILMIDKEVDEAPDVFDLTGVADLWAGDLLTKSLVKPLVQDLFWKEMTALYDEVYGKTPRLSIIRQPQGPLDVYILPKAIDEVVVKEIELIAKQVREGEADIIIFNFQNMADLSEVYLKKIAGILSLLKKDFPRVHAINFNVKIKRKTVLMGLTNLFDPSASLKTILEKYQGPRAFKSRVETSGEVVQGDGFATFDIRVIKPFILATVHGFFEMLDLQIRPGKPEMMKDYFGLHAEFAAVIDISSNYFKGSFIQVFSKAVFTEFFNHITSMNLLHDAQDFAKFSDLFVTTISDRAISEWANETNIDILLKGIRPRVIHGNEQIMDVFKNMSACIHIPVESEIGMFDLFISG